MAMGDVEVNFDKLCSDLETQELESPNCVAAPHVYSQLLALYLLQKDLTNAKFLWKRIPPAVKAANPEIGLVWAVGQKMWQRDFSGVYEALTKEWNNGLQPIMEAVQETTRKRALNLVAHAYSCIGADDFSRFVGLPVADAVKTATSLGWSYDQNTRMIAPKLPDKPMEAMIPSEQQLAQLTDFVSFLEN